MTVADFGDQQLVDLVAGRLGARHPVFAVATVVTGDATVAGRGAGPDADFEIASISKAVTGLLYADAIERGEVSPDATLGQFLPLGDVPAARVSLASLSTHRSGLPSLPPAARQLRRSIDLWRYGTNPFRETLAQLLEQVRGVGVGAPRLRYSNLGFQLLGHAVAAAAGMTFADLVQARVAAPLGIDGLYVPATPGDLRPTALRGRSRRGRAMDTWTGEALGPAAGLRATVHDMARLAGTLLEGGAPGMAALDPVEAFGRGARIGAGWIVTEFDGRAITWHDGRSGGFRSWLGLDRAAGSGAVILSATSASVDRHAFQLVADLTRGGA